MRIWALRGVDGVLNSYDNFHGPWQDRDAGSVDIPDFSSRAARNSPNASRFDAFSERTHGDVRLEHDGNYDLKTRVWPAAV